MWKTLFTDFTISQRCLHVASSPQPTASSFAIINYKESRKSFTVLKKNALICSQLTCSRQQKYSAQIMLIRLRWPAACLEYFSSESSRSLTNQKAGLSTCHDSSKHSGAVLWGSVSGQEAKNSRASACANACKSYILHEQITLLTHRGWNPKTQEDNNSLSSP